MDFAFCKRELEYPASDVDVLIRWKAWEDALEAFPAFIRGY
jgi:hypothetical protein